jgi:hypothetical protein
VTKTAAGSTGSPSGVTRRYLKPYGIRTIVARGLGRVDMAAADGAVYDNRSGRRSATPARTATAHRDPLRVRRARRAPTATAPNGLLTFGGGTGTLSFEAGGPIERKAGT